MVANKQSIEDLGKKHGLEKEKSKTGRPKGEDIGQPNVKTMTKKALERETSKGRKRIKELEGQLAEITQAKKKAEVELAAVITPEMWAIIPVVAYDILAIRFGEHWRLTEKETISYGTAIEKVVNRYLPAIAGEHPELFNLSMVMVAVTVPKIRTTKLIRLVPAGTPPEKKKKKEPKPDEGKEPTKH